MPPWAEDGGMDALYTRLSDPVQRVTIAQATRTPTDAWELYLATGSPDRILLVEFKSDRARAADVSRADDCESPVANTRCGFSVPRESAPFGGARRARRRRTRRSSDRPVEPAGVDRPTHHEPRPVLWSPSTTFPVAPSGVS
jgi:hypothetical protein